MMQTEWVLQETHAELHTFLNSGKGSPHTKFKVEYKPLLFVPKLVQFGTAGKTEFVLKFFIIKYANTNIIRNSCKPKEMHWSTCPNNETDAYLQIVKARIQVPLPHTFKWNILLSRWNAAPILSCLAVRAKATPFQLLPKCALSLCDSLSFFAQMNATTFQPWTKSAKEPMHQRCLPHFPQKPGSRNKCSAHYSLKLQNQFQALRHFSFAHIKCCKDYLSSLMFKSSS